MRPAEFYVYYEDTAKRDRAVRDAARWGGGIEDIDPVDYWANAEPDDPAYRLPDTLAGAIELAARLEAQGRASKGGCRIYRRINPTAYDWDDERPVDDDEIEAARPGATAGKAFA